MDHLSPTHTLLLNKFNVVAYHVLVVTKQFEHQTDPLNLQDLEATWQTVQVTYCALLTLHFYAKAHQVVVVCLVSGGVFMQAIPQGALAYFNCGPESGASQPHKHIQVRLSHYSMLHFPAA